MSFTRLWAFLAIGLPVLAAVIAPMPSVDLTYHLRAGALILDTGRIPDVDTFTFTVAGTPWLDQQWLAQLAMAAVYQAGSWTGLVLLRALLVGLAFGLLFDLIRRRAGSVRTAAWLTLAAFVCSAITLGLRPQLFGITCFAGILWLVARRHQAARTLWLVPAIVVVWANVHGSFVLGPALVAIALVEDAVLRDRRWLTTAAVLVASIIATVVSPFGLGTWTYVTGISTNSVITKRISEWQPTSPLTLEGGLFFLSVILVAIAAVGAARRGRGLGPTAFLWLIPFALLGAWAVRGLAWWPFVAAATVAPLAGAGGGRSASRAPRVESTGIRRLNTAIAALLVVVGVAALPLWRPIDRGLQAPLLVVGAAPSGITGALRQLASAGDHLLAPQPWGSWFEFALPDVRVAVDSRIELFPEAIWDGVDGVASGAAGWQETLSGWNVTLVVASADQVDLISRMTAAGWRDAFHDDDGTVLVLDR